MKVVLMADTIDDLGGVQKFVEGLSLGLKERGIGVTLLARFHAENPVTYLRKNIHSETIFSKQFRENLTASNSTSISVAEREAAGSRLNENFKEGREKLRQMLANMPNDTVIVVTQFGSLAELVRCGLDLASNDRPKIVAQYHGTFEYAKQQKYFSDLIKLYAQCDQTLFLTEADEAAFRAAGIANGKVMVNGVKVIPQTEQEIARRENVVVSLGRYAKEKSLDELIAAWKILHHSFPDWVLELYGSGPEEQALQQLADDPDLDGSVRICGLAESVKTVLSRSKINVMTSHKEGFPVSLLEAAALSVPTVAYNAGPSTPLLVRDGVTGYITNENTPQDFARQLSHLMDSPELLSTMSRAAPTIAQTYDQNVVLDRWVDLLESISFHSSRESPIEIASKSSKNRESGNGNSVESKTEKTQQSIEVKLRNPTPNVALYLYFSGQQIPDKAFAVKVTLFDESGNEMDVQESSLTWSRLLEGGFVYTPATSQSELITLPLIKAKRRVATLLVEPHPWEVRKWKSVPVIYDVLTESRVAGAHSDWRLVDVFRSS